MPDAPKIQNKERIHLVFECLDLAAIIYLNGVEILVVYLPRGWERNPVGAGWRWKLEKPDL